MEYIYATKLKNQIKHTGGARRESGEPDHVMNSASCLSQIADKQAFLYENNLHFLVPCCDENNLIFFGAAKVPVEKIHCESDIEPFEEIECGFNEDVVAERLEQWGNNVGALSIKIPSNGTLNRNASYRNFSAYEGDFVLPFAENEYEVEYLASLGDLWVKEVQNRNPIDEIFFEYRISDKEAREIAEKMITALLLPPPPPIGKLSSSTNFPGGFVIKMDHRFLLGNPQRRYLFSIPEKRIWDLPLPPSLMSL